MWALTLALGIVVVLAITVVTGYFVAQEFAYMAVDRSRLSARAAQGDAAATRALAVTKRTSFMLSGAQLGITITGLLVGYVAEPLIGRSISTALGVSVPTGVGLAIGTVVALLVSTLVQMLFGELFPKNLAIARPEQVATKLARSTSIYLLVLGWLIAFFDKASNLLLRLFRIEPVHDVEHAATRQDLEHIVADSAVAGALPQDLSVLIDRIIDFPERDVEHAMVPLARTGVVQIDDTIADVRHRMATEHSRYPVIDAQRDVAGVVDLHDLLDLPAERDGDRVATITRPGVLVPTTMGLPDALAALTESGEELACVIDEYGGLAGIVTVEDMAEEIMGDLVDEHDPEPTAWVSQDGEDRWLVLGETPLDEVERAIGRELPRGDQETLAGLVIAGHGALPEIGDRVEIRLPLDTAELAEPGRPVPRALVAEVTEVERHVPSRLRIDVVELPDSDEDEQEAEHA